MTRRRFCTSFLGKPITAEVTVLEEGVQVLLTGGDKPHVGAAALAQAGRCCCCQALPGHREAEIAAQWAAALSAVFGSACVVCGIHYDRITPPQIQQVCDLCSCLLEQALRFRSGEGEAHLP